MKLLEMIRNRNQLHDRQRKSEGGALPRFHFQHGHFDERHRNPFGQTRRAQAVIETHGKRLLLRQMGDYVLFREAANKSQRDAYFFLQPLRTGKEIKHIPLSVFSLAFAEGNYGRCLLYAADYMYDDEAVFLFLTVDGSSFALHEDESIPFRWNTGSLASPQDILIKAPQTLDPMCETLFRTKINPNLRNPYVLPGDLPEEEVTWRSGSLTELQKITRWICYTEPDLFQYPNTLTVVYRAQFEGDPGGCTMPWMGSERAKRRFEQLARLAFACNRFEGYKWSRINQARNRLNSYRKIPLAVSVPVMPPSAHERAAALLDLADWLEGRVSGKERRRYLMPDRAASGNRVH